VTAQTREALASEGAAQLALDVALGPKPHEVVADVLTEAQAIQEAELGSSGRIKYRPGHLLCNGVDGVLVDASFFCLICLMRLSYLGVTTRWFPARRRSLARPSVLVGAPSRS
jgi:hypothetical protein